MVCFVLFCFGGEHFKVASGFRIADKEQGTCVATAVGARGPERVGDLPRVSAQGLPHWHFGSRPRANHRSAFYKHEAVVAPELGGGEATGLAQGPSPQPRPPLLPWKQQLLQVWGREAGGSLETVSLGAQGSVPPACPGGLEEAGEMGPRPCNGLATGLSSPAGARRPCLPSWASSAGINTIKGMFSLLLGFTMCRERKNKLFVPTWAIGWRQNFLRKARKLPSAFQKRRWAEARGPGTRENEGPSPGLVGEAQEGQGIQGTESRLESGEVTLHPSPALDPRDTPGRLWSLAKRRLCPLGEAAWCRGSRRDTSPLTPLPCV